MAPTANKKKSAAQVDRDQRAYLAKVMDQVAIALNKFLGQDYPSPSSDDGGDEEMMAFNPIPAELADTLQAAVTKVATLVEAAVPQVFAA